MQPQNRSWCACDFSLTIMRTDVIRQLQELVAMLAIWAVGLDATAVVAAKLSAS